MNEEEAKTKWCPMVRCDGNNRHWGRENVAAPISCCVASACMAWRWSKLPEHGSVVELRPAVPVNGSYEMPEGFHYRTGGPNAMWVRHDMARGGNCGLAGRP